MVAQTLTLPRSPIGVSLALSLALHAVALGWIARYVVSDFSPAVDVAPPSLPELVVTLRTGEAVAADAERERATETTGRAAAAAAAPADAVARPPRAVVVRAPDPNRVASRAGAEAPAPLPTAPPVPASGAALPSPAQDAGSSPGLAEAHAAPGSTGDATPRAAAVETSVASPSSTPVAYRHHPAPAYPETARREGQQGVAVVEVAVSRDGAPLDARIAQSSGHAALDAGALDAVRQWRFTPATRDGEAIESRIRIPIRFRLTDDRR